MKTDKTKLLKDIEAMKEKLASMEEELNKTEEFKHFPSKDDKYYYYLTTGTICSNDSSSDDLKVNAYKTREEADKAYNKAVALEKIKRKIIELQGDWKPNFEDTLNEVVIITYNHYRSCFASDVWRRIEYPTLIPNIKTIDISETIINEMQDELKLIFNIA